MALGTPLANAMMDDGMMERPYTWAWMAGLWIVLVVIAILVYHDAQKRGMNSLLWAILVLIPMFGFLALIIYLVVRETGQAQAATGKSAQTLLDERYARGEISRDEYLRMKADLNQAPK